MGLHNNNCIMMELNHPERPGGLGTPSKIFFYTWRNSFSIEHGVKRLIGESWEQKLKTNFPKDFNFIDNARKNKNRKSKRNSGGILVCYKKELKENIITIDKATENMIWINLCPKRA